MLRISVRSSQLDFRKRCFYCKIWEWAYGIIRACFFSEYNVFLNWWFCFASKSKLTRFWDNFGDWKWNGYYDPIFSPGALILIVYNEMTSKMKFLLIFKTNSKEQKNCLFCCVAYFVAPLTTGTSINVAVSVRRTELSIQ